MHCVWNAALSGKNSPSMHDAVLNAQTCKIPDWSPASSPSHCYKLRIIIVSVLRTPWLIDNGRVLIRLLNAASWALHEVFEELDTRQRLHCLVRDLLWNPSAAN